MALPYSWLDLVLRLAVRKSFRLRLRIWKLSFLTIDLPLRA